MCQSSPPPTITHLQDGLLKRMRPFCYLSACGQHKFVAAVKRMEKSNKCTLNSFKAAGALWPHHIEQLVC